MISAVLAIVLAAVPVRVADGLEPANEVRQLAIDHWASLEATFQQATGKVASTPRQGVVIERSRLAPGTAGLSGVGHISLRQSVSGSLSAPERTALRHELGHQFLFLTCGSSTSDQLFHEAFALATSGELIAWKEGDYQSLSQAAATLQFAKSLDTQSARNALARLLAESTKAEHSLPEVLRAGLAACDGKTRWPSLTVEALAKLTVDGDLAVVAMSRHTGEVLWSSGDIQKARPFGSTLKPFVLAGAASTPVLMPVARDPEWACGEIAPTGMNGSQAVLRSCNGYFLDWAKSSPGVERFGSWGTVLQSMGLERLPTDMSEAIGLRTTLSLTPLSLAAAYRLLAEARPDLVETMKRNSTEGTLAALPESPLLSGVALKTGTVRDGSLRATMGWIVAITPDAVIVHVQPERAPKQFVSTLIEELTRARSLAGRDAVEAQVFGLLHSSVVKVRCGRGGFAIAEGAPSPLTISFSPLNQLLGQGRLVCLGAPFEARLDSTSSTRLYAGVFRHDAPAPYVPNPNQTVTDRERRARAGSEVIFRTSRLSYVAGVLEAEDASITGEARAALARVISHNVDTHDRHGSRPVCDTTHCQTFKGSAAPRQGDAQSLARPELIAKEWLPFSRGGSEAWQQTRSRREIDRALGFSWSTVTGFRQNMPGTFSISRTVIDEGVPSEVTEELPCEKLRGPLKLPSCPGSATLNGPSDVTFSGEGQGHGLGLDVEAAKRSKLSQDEILRTTFGSL